MSRFKFAATRSRDAPTLEVEEQKKKLLLIAPAYRPAPGVGAVRVEGLAKYLPLFGWRVTLTVPAIRGMPPRDLPHVLEVHARPLIPSIRQWFRIEPGESASARLSPPRSNAEVRRALRFALNLAKSLVAYPDAYRARIRPTILTAINAMAASPPDVVLSSSPPVSHHIVAARLAEMWRIPWVADLRDPWSDNPYQDAPAFRAWLDQGLERKYLQKASRITCVSEELSSLISGRYSREVRVITNGFDPEHVSPDERQPDTGKLVISHTGGLYEGKRDPSALLYALRRLIDLGEIARERVDVRFFGPREAWLDRVIEELGLGGIVQQRGTVTRPSAIAAQRESSALLLLTWDHPSELGTCPAKVFEYMAARRPVVAVGSIHSAGARVVTDTRIGKAFSSKDVQGLQDFIKKLYDDIIEFGHAKYFPDEARVTNYSQVVMAKKMAEVLGSAVASGRKEDRSSTRA